MIVSDLSIFEELDSQELKDLEGGVGFAFSFYASRSGITDGSGATINDTHIGYARTISGPNFSVSEVD
ncbi:MAG: hypothetical protein AB4372_01000 [Xenococcus sp. (in: cyanobacteria)]